MDRMGSADPSGSLPRPKKGKVIQYLPGTFEGMMEAFGKNLQRQTLYEEFYQGYKDIAALSNKHNTQMEIINKV